MNGSTTALELLIRTKLDAQAFTDLGSNVATIQQQSSNIDFNLIDPSKFAASAEQVSIVKSRIRELTMEMENLKAQSVQSLKGGDMLGAELYADEATGIKSVIDGLREYTTEASKTANQNQSLFESFTKLGFKMLIFENTLKTIVNTINRFFEAASQGASTLDRTQGFANLTTGVGLNAQQMRKDLEEAAGGLTSFSEASKGTIQLIQAGLPGAAAYSDDLLKIARSAAIVQGDISKTGYIMNSLTTGIVRDSPRLIDNANILLKLGEVYEDFARAQGTTADALTITERKMAVLNAVLEQGANINDMADSMDSLAAKLQEVRTEFSKAGEAAKEGFGLALVSIVEATDSTLLKMKDLRFEMSSMAELNLEDRLAVLSSYFTSWEGLGFLLGQIFNLIGSAVVGLVAWVKDLGKWWVLNWEFMGSAVDLVFAKLRGENVQGAFESLKAQQSDLLALTLQNVTGINAYIAAIDNFNANTDKALQGRGVLQPEVPEGLDFTVDEEPNTDKAEELAEKLRDIERDKQQTLADLARDGARDRADADTDLARELTDINRDLADDLADAARDHQREMADLRRDYAQELLDIDIDLADKLRDIDVDLARDLAEESSKSQEERLSEQIDYARKIEDAEDDHQKKLADIYRKYEASRRKALIDRDARGLADAKAALDSDLDAANETNADKMKDIREYHKDKLEEIKREEEEERQSAIDAANQKREDAKADAERARRDAASEHAQRLLDKQREYADERRDAQLNAERKRRDAEIEHDREMADLRLQNQRRLEEIATEYKRELAELDGYYQTRIEKTSEYVAQEISQYEVLNTAHKNLIPTVTVTQGTGDDNRDPSGNPWPDPNNPANVRPGVACQYSSRVYTGIDGQQYHCIGGIWSLVGGAGFNSVGTTGFSLSANGSTIPTTGGGRSAGRQVLTINTENDDLLSKILSEVAYEAIIEVIN